MPRLPEEHRSIESAFHDVNPWRLTNNRAYDRMAPDYHRRSEAAGFEDDARHLVSSLTLRFGPRPRVLDLGCGPGTDAWRLADAGAAAICLDGSIGMLGAATSREVPAVLLAGDLLYLPFVSQAFPGIWACGSLMHVPRRLFPKALEEARRVLIPGGMFYLTLREGSGEDEASLAPGLIRRFARYSPSEAATLLERAGFTLLIQDLRVWPGDPAQKPWMHILASRP